MLVVKICGLLNWNLCKTLNDKETRRPGINTSNLSADNKTIAITSEIKTDDSYLQHVFIYVEFQNNYILESNLSFEFSASLKTYTLLPQPLTLLHNRKVNSVFRDALNLGYHNIIFLINQTINQLNFLLLSHFCKFKLQNY